MSQVKNLRAMFENKADTSPPDRGRSPAVGPVALSGTSASVSPRPLSKVRTSFVAVEKEGRIGLRREPSGESSLSRRRMSADTEADSSATLHETVSTPLEEPKMLSRVGLSKDSIPESPRADRSAEKASVLAHPGGELLSSTASSKSAPPTRPDSVTKTPNLPHSKKAATPGRKPPQPNAPTTAQPDSSSRGATAAYSCESTRRGTTTSASAPPSASQSKLVVLSPRGAGHADNARPGDETPKKALAHSSPAKATKAVSKQALQPSHSSGVGFAKPKPKSPTRPIALPASLMAPTTASNSKTHGQRQSLSRMSGNLPSAQPPSRSNSRASATRSQQPRELKRQSSVVSRPRPSIGPPPKKKAQDHPVAKRDRDVDDSFLARMMRPTQSSSSKTAEKAAVTPPRKSANSRRSGQDITKLPNTPTSSKNTPSKPSAPTRLNADAVPSPKEAGLQSANAAVFAPGGSRAATPGGCTLATEMRGILISAPQEAPLDESLTKPAFVDLGNAGLLAQETETVAEEGPPQEETGHTGGSDRPTDVEQGIEPCTETSVNIAEEAGEPEASGGAFDIDARENRVGDAGAPAKTEGAEPGPTLALETLDKSDNDPRAA